MNSKEIEYSIKSRGTNPIYGPYLIIAWGGGTFGVREGTSHEEIVAEIRSNIIPQSYIDRYGTASE